jgi:protein O-GlcNAc transferase
VSIQGNFPPLRRDLGILLAEQQSYPQAVVQLEKAVGLGLEDAQLYNFLGIAYSKTNRAVKAIESYRKAIKLDSSLAEAHLNLGFVYQKQNRRHAALEEYKAACTLREKYCGMVPSDSR